MKPTKGMRFRHARVLDTAKFDRETLQVYQVTRIASDMVWFAPVYDIGYTNERLGRSDKCSVEYFPKIYRDLSARVPFAARPEVA